MQHNRGPVDYIGDLHSEFKAASAAGKLAIVSDGFSILGVSGLAIAANVYLQLSGFRIDLWELFLMLAVLVLSFVVLMFVMVLFSYVGEALGDSTPGQVIYYGMQAFALFAWLALVSFFGQVMLRDLATRIPPT